MLDWRCTHKLMTYESFAFDHIHDVAVTLWLMPAMLTSSITADVYMKPMETYFTRLSHLWLFSNIADISKKYNLSNAI